MTAQTSASRPPDLVPVRGTAHRRGPALTRRPTAPLVALLGALLAPLLVVAGGLLVVPQAVAATPAPVPTLFPSDRLTVRDDTQLTGRRVALPVPRTCSGRESDCAELALLNGLDGFDLDPRVAVGFRRQVDVRRVSRSTVWLQAVAGGPRIGLERLVFSPATGTLYGHPERLLEERTAYRLVVTAAVSGTGARTTFTTLSATSPLHRVRRQLDDGRAYRGAGITDRTITFQERLGGLLPSVYRADAITGISRLQDRGSGGLVRQEVRSTLGPGTGTLAFGSFLSPQYLDRSQGAPGVWPQVGTRRDPPVQDAARLGVVVVLPAGLPPAGGWPTAVFGAGLNRSRFDVLLAADRNAASGIATVATDQVGHGYGFGSLLEVRTDDGTVALLESRGRGEDVDGDGAVTASEGLAQPDAPHPLSALGYRDGLRQSAVDVMALVRAVAAGVDVNGDLLPDLRPTGVSYYGQSLGAVYGTLAVGVDPLLSRALLNVGGGSLTDVVRRGAGFRRGLATTLHRRRPALTTSGRDGFTESMPLPGEAPETRPAVGATRIQDYLARAAWLQRSGDAVAAAPLLRLRRLPDVVPKDLLVQVAYGDRTLVNSASGALVRAGRLADVTTLHRADLGGEPHADPHGFLLEPGRLGKPAAQEQLVRFLVDGSVVDPDGDAPAFQALSDPRVLDRDNLPQTPPGSRPPPPERPGV